MPLITRSPNSQVRRIVPLGDKTPNGISNSASEPDKSLAVKNNINHHFNFNPIGPALSNSSPIKPNISLNQKNSSSSRNELSVSEMQNS